MEVASECSSPFMTAPSSPQRFGNFFFSAPTSPTRISAFCNHDNTSHLATSECETNFEDDDDEEFEFNFSGQLMEKPALSADELFYGGKIRPLKSSFTDFDYSSHLQEREKHQRGRDRSKSSRRETRSLSPLRVSGIMFDDQEQELEDSKNNGDETESRKATSGSLSYVANFLSRISLKKRNNKKWKLKDLLLFRSSSEGRVHEVKTQGITSAKLDALSNKLSDSRNGSFRSTAEGSVGSGSSRRRSTSASAHEVHYTMNRAVSEQMRRKTFLPYKNGLLGCIA